jgi:hypothetical protein
METGKPIWVESLLTKEEWKQCKQKYPSLYNLSEPPPEFDCDFKWRRGMGKPLTAFEIENINKNIDAILEKAKLKQIQKETINSES